ncbi:ABC transporter permease [Rhodococcus sp. NPDC056960]|uniref:ABC transporter permease n=1 Tax=Rhodococcus sp. NPDC056960 TaxID=3345982 RepID=UPI003631A6CF
MIDFLLDGAHWTGPEGIPALLLQHLLYTFLALFAAALIAVPLGLYTGRGAVVVAGLANSLRALPTIGLLILLVLVIAPSFSTKLAYLVPSLIVLVLLAIPPILTNTYAGIRAVDPAAVDAARGMGFRSMRILTEVEMPCALPLMLSGIRSAVLQIVSTATVAAYISLGGLGRLLIDGKAQSDYAQMAAGAVLVSLLALAFDLAIGFLTVRVVSPGLTRRVRSSGTRSASAKTPVAARASSVPEPSLT